MGDSEIVETQDSQNSGENQKSVGSAVVMLLLGLFTPLFVIYRSYGISWYLSIQSIFWMYSAAPTYFPGQGLILLPLNGLVIIFPFILLRLVPVSQIYRYYQGKTTRRRTVITFFIGDGISLSYALYAVFMITYGMDTRIIPIIAQIIFGAIMVWRFPFQEPRIPWDTVLEEGKWWDKDERSPQEKENPKDKDELW